MDGVTQPTALDSFFNLGGSEAPASAVEPTTELTQDEILADVKDQITPEAKSETEIAANDAPENTETPTPVETEAIDEWAEVKSLGTPAEIKAAAEAFFKLYQPVMENDAPVMNPITQTPQYSSLEGLKELQGQAPGQVAQMFTDLAMMDSPVGVPYIAQFFKDQFKIEPEQLGAFLRGELVKPELPGVEPELLEAFNEEEKGLIRQMKPGVREQFFYADANAQREFLDDLKEKQALKAEVEGVKKRQAEAERLETETFERTTAEMGEKYVAELRDTTISQVIENLNTKYSFSQDAKQNDALNGFVKMALMASLNPDSATVLTDAFNALDIKLDPSFFRASQVAAAKAAEVKRLEAIATSPRFKQYADPAALRAAQRDLDGSIVQVKSVMAGIAGQFAKALGATAKAKASAATNAAKNAAARPNVNGSPTPATINGQKPDRVDTFFNN